jgi:AbrB family looped-hinge helix DNA binding protein
MAWLAKSVRVSAKGQIVIPIEVRRRLGIRSGDTLVIIGGSDQALVMKAGRYMESLRGMAKNVYGRTRKEIDAYVRGERQWWQG